MEGNAVIGYFQTNFCTDCIYTWYNLHKCCTTEVDEYDNKYVHVFMESMFDIVWKCYPGRMRC